MNQTNELTVDSSRTVILFFDDGYYSVYQYAFPLLKFYKMPASLGIVSSKVTKRYSSGYLKQTKLGFMGRQEIQEMIDSLGVEIASHSVSHCSLTTVTDSMIRKYELIASKQTLESLFGQKVNTFVYPYGRYDDQIIRIAQQIGYKLGRTCEFGDINFWVAPFKIPIKEVRNTTTLQEISKYINRHDETVLLFHRILPKAQNFTEYSVSRFHDLLAMLSAQKIKVLTLSGLYEQWRQQILQRLVLQSRLFVTDREKSYMLLFQQVDIDQTRTPSRF